MNEAFGATMFGGPLYLTTVIPPPPPPPYVDSANYFRLDIHPEGFKRRYESGK